MTSPVGVADRRADLLRQAGYPVQAAAVGRPARAAAAIPDPGNPIEVAAAAAAAAAGPAAAIAGGTTDALNTLAGVSVGIVKAGNWISNRRNWIRIAYVAGGVGLVLGAMLLVVVQRTEGRASALVGVGTKVWGATKGRGASSAGSVAA